MTVRVLNHLGDFVRDAVEAAGVTGVELIDIPAQGSLPDDARGEVLVTLSKIVTNLDEALDRDVRWVHEMTTGVDESPLDLIFADPSRTLTCARGASAVPISEWVLAQILASVKRLPEAWHTEPPDNWNLSLPLGEAAGQTVGVVGLGGIGSRVARLARAFEMEVIAVRRTDRPSPIDGVRVTTDLAEVLGAADHLVLAAPATDATKHLLDADALAKVKPGVHIVNIARGSLIDQDALAVALDDGRVGRASLDVCTPEPLPAGHWLWSHPQVHLSPHLSWSSPHGLTRSVDGFVENLARYVAGEPLHDVVDPNDRY